MVAAAGGGVKRLQGVISYVLNPVDTRSNSVVLTVTAKPDEAAAKPLAELYSTAEDTTKKAGAELLRKIIQG